MVYSSVAIRFIEGKVEFLQDVCRVLKPGGVALLQIGGANWQYPYCLVCDEKILTPYMTRFVLKYGDELVPLETYLKLFENDSFKFEFIHKKSCVIRIFKLKSGRINFQLSPDEKLTVEMRELSHWQKRRKRGGGIRSVYNLNSENYQRLFEEGLLSRDELRTDIMLPEELIVEE